MFVGGIINPKHFGQSGQPIPLPVILTMDPARITRKVNIIDICNNRLNKKVHNVEGG